MYLKKKKKNRGENPYDEHSLCDISLWEIEKTIPESQDKSRQ